MRSWLKNSDARQMSSTEAAWLAGFIDGEGTVCSYRGGRGGKYQSWILSVTNTNLASLEYCRAITGVGSVRSKRRHNVPEHWKQSYQWQVTAQREIIDVLRQIVGFLQIKRDVAKAFIDNWRDVEN